MAVKVAINGFGRIGRLAFRQMFGAEGYEVVAGRASGVRTRKRHSQSVRPLPGASFTHSPSRGVRVPITSSRTSSPVRNVTRSAMPNGTVPLAGASKRSSRDKSSLCSTGPPRRQHWPQRLQDDIRHYPSLLNVSADGTGLRPRRQAQVPFEAVQRRWRRDIFQSNSTPHSPPKRKRPHPHLGWNRPLLS